MQNTIPPTDWAPFACYPNACIDILTPIHMNLIWPGQRVFFSKQNWVGSGGLEHCLCSAWPLPGLVFSCFNHPDVLYALFHVEDTKRLTAKLLTIAVTVITISFPLRLFESGSSELIDSIPGSALLFNHHTKKKWKWNKIWLSRVSLRFWLTQILDLCHQVEDHHLFYHENNTLKALSKIGHENLKGELKDTADQSSK